MGKQNQEDFLEVLKNRFEKNKPLHPSIQWKDVDKKLRESPKKISILKKMEETGGEPDVIGWDEKTNAFIFCDCSTESPKERRSWCYDKAAWESRKQNKPENNAVDVAKEMGVELLTEEEYKQLQSLGNFDLKTSSWLKTPDNIRKFGGAIFGDKRYNHTFIYHNGADSYYAARGFRGLLKV